MKVVAVVMFLIWFDLGKFKYKPQDYLYFPENRFGKMTDNLEEGHNRK